MSPQLVVRYNNGLRIGVEGISLREFTESSIWRIRLGYARSLSSGFDGCDIIFPPDLPLAQVKQIVESLDRARRAGYEVLVFSSVEHAREQRAAHLAESARVGLAIKNDDPGLNRQLAEFKGIVDASMVRPLRDRQMRDAFFMTTLGKAANFSVPGSGKTASVLGMYAFLHARGLVDRMLVMCPINAFGSWRDEWAATFGEKNPCSSLCFRDERWAQATRDAKLRALEYDIGRYNLVLMNYEVKGLEDKLADIASSRCLLVFDEVHRVKRIGGGRAQTALEVARRAPYAVALTGTPIPNSYLDIYNMLHLLYPEDYDAYFELRPEDLNHPGPQEIEGINELLQPFFCRTNKRDLDVPEPNEDVLMPVLATRRETDALLMLRKRFMGDPLALIIRVLQLESDPRMLLDVVDGEDVDVIFDSIDARVSASAFAALGAAECAEVAHEGPTAKMRQCLDLVEQLVGEGKTVIVWCIFKHSMSSIQQALERRGIAVSKVCGGMEMTERDRQIGRFKSGESRVLVTNPHTLAESVSLHHMCHDAVYFECSYNLVHLLQSKDRIHRLGLPSDQYTQYYYLQTDFALSEDGPWSLDRNIYERLCEKERVMLDAIDRGSLEAGSTDKRDLEIVFKGLLDV